MTSRSTSINSGDSNAREALCLGSGTHKRVIECLPWSEAGDFRHDTSFKPQPKKGDAIEWKTKTGKFVFYRPCGAARGNGELSVIVNGSILCAYSVSEIVRDILKT